MSQVMTLRVEQAAFTTTNSISTPAVSMAPPPPPPPTHRRPRVREVSSRFMSPVASSSSSSSSSSRNHKLHQQQNHGRHQDSSHVEGTFSAFENHRHIETTRSLESPFLFQRPSRHQQRQPHQRRSGNSLRPDTPTVMTSSLSSSTRPRLIQRTTAATKLLQSLSSQDDTSSNASDDNSSQLSESDVLPTVSNRLPGERNINRVNSSLSLRLSIASVKGSEKATPAVSRSFTNSGKVEGFSLPPVAPPQTKAGTDVRKGKKVSSLQEDVQSLKLLHNHYLQWRFANAKAAASMQAQRGETESTLYFCGFKIAEMYDSVKRKRIELGILRRTKLLSTVLEAQMPYLEEWGALEGDYSKSLSEAIQALVNASLQLPIGGNVRADVREVGEALNSSVKLMETIILNVQSYMPKAEEVEFLMSELAKVTGGERALIEECGGLLSKTHEYQVEECSLRGQFMQLHKRLPAKLQEEEIKNSSSLRAVHMR
ncbi:protein ENDOSPERM DEFECTIVE 1 [Mangifera indica]|uniref:protein ENDOSPERM DEFECTIVE 1 n=1 Tax=Mangifera indica TaxID=29780 RepID=UPI001CF9B440|nr:protein ENDOSPERM DEFECTIVE 1 [Mangifera indica]